MKDTWNCVQCGALLGIDRSPRLHVRYKQLDLMVDGEDYVVTTSCRKCGRLNEHHRSNSAPQPVTASFRA